MMMGRDFFVLLGIIPLNQYNKISATSLFKGLLGVATGSPSEY
jgi:hypothetical protein